MPKELQSQHDQRVSATDNESGDFFTDQHGRSWHAEVEIVTGHPCTPLNPDGWSAPLDTPRNYIDCLRGRKARGAAREAYDLRIDYQKWISDWTESGKAWDANATKKAIELYGAAWDRTKGYPVDVMLVVGPRPGANLEAVKAAAAGHPYVLGLREYNQAKPTDKRLHDILFPTYEVNETNWLADEEPVKKPRERNLAAVTEE